MTYEAVPTSVQASPSLLAQYVQGRLPGVREVPDATENARQLVEMVEQGLITVESIRGNYGEVVDPALAEQVTALVQANHAATQTAARTAELDGAVEVNILPGIDDVDAAMKKLKAKEWTLTGDALRVSGFTAEKVGAALQATRP